MTSRMAIYFFIFEMILDNPSTRNASKKAKILRNDFRPTKETRGSIIAKKNLKMLLGSDQLEQNLEELESFILAFVIFNKLFVDDILNKLSTTEFRNKSLRNLKEIFLTLKFDQEELIEKDPNFIKVEKTANSQKATMAIDVL